MNRKTPFDIDDPRFQVANREALAGVALVLFNFIWWYGFAYGLGSKPVEEYTYILGLPAWFFYSCVVGFIVMAILIVILVNGFFKEVSFEDKPEKERGRKE
ncbi:YhdT family protein [Evansella halocellulosilytica]|uniref:YhdT family protein n=1 Tax=Evansella halocellulosilytica TaxID=2011013 RepID=UPI000BB9B379|nr:YhdT family protein [Evansella halocellulosilytica]